MAKYNKIDEIVYLKKTSEKMIKGLLLAKNLHRSIDKAVKNAEIILSEGIDPDFQSAEVEELVLILNKVKALRDDLDKNHSELLSWHPPKDLVI